MKKQNLQKSKSNKMKNDIKIVYEGSEYIIKDMKNGISIPVELFKRLTAD